MPLGSATPSSYPTQIYPGYPGPFLFLVFLHPPWISWEDNKITGKHWGSFMNFHGWVGLGATRGYLKGSDVSQSIN